MNIAAGAHAPDEVLAQYVRSGCPKNVSEELQKHIQFCERCQMALGILEQFIFGRNSNDE